VTAYGRLAKAPCGHAGEHIFGSYVRCNAGCDAVAPRPSSATGDPHLDAFGKTYDLVAAGLGAPWASSDWPTKPPGTMPGFKFTATVLWTPEEVRGRAYGNGHDLSMRQLRRHRESITAQLFHAALCGQIERLPRPLLNMANHDVVDYLENALKMARLPFYTCVLAAPLAAIQHMTAGGSQSILSDLHGALPAGIHVVPMATDNGVPMVSGTSAVLVPVHGVVFHDESTPPRVVSVNRVDEKIAVVVEQTVRIHTLDFSPCVRVEGLA
jgi:hypothetical protein